MNNAWELRIISQFAGEREDLVQAGGGNSSVKCDKNQMLIKASGLQLSEVTEVEGFAIVNYSKIRKIFLTRDIDTIVQEDEEKLLREVFISGERPSIETFLHAITDKVTLHTHPMVVNILTTRKGGMEVLKELFPEALFINYATPGIRLAKELFKNCKEPEMNKIIFLKNHGVIVSGKNSQEVIERTEQVVTVIEKYLNLNMDVYRDVTVLSAALNNQMPQEHKGIVAKVSNSNIIETLKMFNGKMWSYQFCPDCVVYAGKKELVIKNNLENEISEHLKLYGIPRIIFYKEKMYIFANSTKKARDIECIVAFSAEIAKQNHLYEMDILEDEELNFLLNWEAEKYRQNK